MNNLITLKNVSVSYKDTLVLADINVGFYDNNLYFIQGESGSGKTTILNLLNQTIQPTSGEIIYDKNIKVSTMYTNNTLLNTLTGLENLMLVTNDTSKINYISNRLNIEYLLDKCVKDYSQGEYQKMALARTLLNDADVYLIDEIFSNLDSKNSNLVIKLLEEISNDHLVIVVSNNDYNYDKYNCYKIIDSKLVNISSNINNKVSSRNLKNNLKLNLKKLYLFNKSLIKTNLLSYIFMLIFVVLFIVISSIGINVKDSNHERLKFISDNNIKLVYDNVNDYIYTSGDEIYIDNIGYKLLVSKTDSVTIGGKLYNLNEPIIIDIDNTQKALLCNKYDHIKYMQKNFQSYSLDFIDNTTDERVFFTLETHNLEDDIILIKHPRAHSKFNIDVINNINIESNDKSYFRVIYEESDDVLNYTAYYSSNVIDEIVNEYSNSHLFKHINDVKRVKDLSKISFIGLYEPYDYDSIVPYKTSWLYISIGFSIFSLLVFSVIIYFINHKSKNIYKQIELMNYSNCSKVFIITTSYLFVIIIGYLIGLIVEILTIKPFNKLFTIYGHCGCDFLLTKHFNYLVMIEFIIICIIVVLTSLKKYKKSTKV